MQTPYSHILFPFDGSDPSRRAENAALGLAESLGCHLTLLHVVPSFPVTLYAEGAMSAAPDPAEYERQQRSAGEQLLAPLKATAAARGIACDAMVAVNDQPYLAIIAAAERFNCDLILMASHGRRGWAGLLLGSETQKVLTHSKMPVLVYR